ncbi:MAG TPA: hypothetical protein V6C69_10235, partial [Trichormus sp.]
KNGENSTTIDYQRDAQNQVKLDKDGKPLIQKIDTVINGKHQTIDLGDNTADNAELRRLAERIYVSQKGDSIGNISIFSGDGKTISQLKSDFSTTTHELGTRHDGTQFARIRDVMQANGSYTSFKYEDPRDETKATHISERIKTAFDKWISQESDRIPNTNRFITHNEQGKISWRDGMRISDDGKLAYKELSENFFDGASEHDGTRLDEAKEEFVKVAAAHGVFKGSTGTINKWLHKWEAHVHHFRNKQWAVATDDQMAESLVNLTKVFTDKPSGRATRISGGERRLAVECELKELGDPEKWINQGPVGTCGVNSTEDMVCERRPQDLTRWLRQALTLGYVTSRGVDKNGHHRRVDMTEQQLKYEPTYGRSYSNQLYQFAAIASLGYRDTGGSFPGTTNDDISYIHKMCTGKDVAGFHDTWQGTPMSAKQLRAALKKGSVAYIIPGHAMAISDYNPKTNKFLVNNWWGQPADNDGYGPIDGYHNPGSLYA